MDTPVSRRAAAAGPWASLGLLLAGMLLFTWLALLGFDRVRLKTFERYEAGLLAVLFGVLAVLVVVLEHGHEH